MSYSIGDKAHGGIVFYVDENGENGKVAALEDQTSGASWEKAKDLCNNFDGGGFYDWYFPSKAELLLMYTNLRKENLGDFTGVAYWCSTEIDSSYANMLIFATGLETGSGKGASLCARAIRSF